jgi:hypothetical protein
MKRTVSIIWNIRKLGDFDKAFTSVRDWQVVDQMEDDPFLSWALELGQCNKTCSCKWWWWWWWWWWWRRRRSMIFCFTANFTKFWNELELNDWSDLSRAPLKTHKRYFNKSPIFYLCIYLKATVYSVLISTCRAK